jgi:hypothetical protein
MIVSPRARVKHSAFGVKDAIFDTLPLEEFELQIFGRLKASFCLPKLEPACARKFVEGAVAYARDLGFPPHADIARQN